MRSHSIKLRSLSGLEGCGIVISPNMYLKKYSHLTEYLSKESYKSDLLCTSTFIKRSPKGFTIQAICVENINLISTLRELERIPIYLKRVQEERSQ